MRKKILIFLVGLCICNCTIIQRERFDGRFLNVTTSVVKIIIESEKLLNNKGQATGFFCIDSKTIITAEHIIPTSENYNLKFQYKDNKFNLKLLYRNPELDIAILEVVEKNNILFPKPIKISQRSAYLTQEVFAIGYPYNKYIVDNHPTINAGNISSKDRYIVLDDKEKGPFYQADLYASDGFSGSPVFNSMGHFLGMVNYIYAKDNGLWQGATYITPSIDIYKFLEGIKKKNEKKKNNSSKN